MKKNLIAIISVIATAVIFVLGIYFSRSFLNEKDKDNVQTNTAAEIIRAENITENDIITEEITTKEVTEIISEENSDEIIDDVEAFDISYDELKILVEENIYCNMIYNVKTLPTKEEIDYESENYLYETDSEKFPDYASFESYIRSVYCEAEAERLLYNCPYEGMPRYTELNGKLCVDSRYLGSKGYYVDWTNFSFTINSSDNNRVSFTLCGKAEYPSDEPVIEEYLVDGVAVYEDGGWRLGEMLY